MRLNGKRWQLLNKTRDLFFYLSFHCFLSVWSENILHWSTFSFTLIYFCFDFFFCSFNMIWCWHVGRMSILHTYWTLNSQLLISISNFNLLSFADSGSQKKNLRKSSQIFNWFSRLECSVGKIKQRYKKGRTADNLCFRSLAAFLFWKVVLKTSKVYTVQVHPNGIMT